jgi:Holliday junction resolvase RusA-like endonuclease
MAENITDVEFDDVDAPTSSLHFVEFDVNHEPVGKGRPRFTFSGHAYTPQQTRDFEAVVEDAAEIAMGELDPFTGPLKAEIVAYFSIPKSMSQKDRVLVRQGRLFPRKKLDADNIAKAVLDACNAIVYHDDSQVMVLRVAKMYADGKRSGLHVRIAQIKTSWD